MPDHRQKSPFRRTSDTLVFSHPDFPSFDGVTVGFRLSLNPPRFKRGSRASPFCVRLTRSPPVGNFTLPRRLTYYLISGYFSRECLFNQVNPPPLYPAQTRMVPLKTVSWTEGPHIRLRIMEFARIKRMASLGWA